MWNLHWTGVRLPSPPLMKTTVLLLLLYLMFVVPNFIKGNKGLSFLIDGRPKHITYCNISFRIIHIDIQTVKPRCKTDHAVFDTINIFFFPEDFHLTYTLGTYRIYFEYL